MHAILRCGVVLAGRVRSYSVFETGCGVVEDRIDCHPTNLKRNVELNLLDRCNVLAKL